MTDRFLEPAYEAGRAFVMRKIPGQVLMLNLLRFRALAGYAAHPGLAPADPITGAAAYDRYMALTLPLLRQRGGDVDFVAAGGPLLIGPEEARWDLVLLVRHQSVESFLAFATDQDYLAGIGHRFAALEDSRLLPLSALPVPV